MPDALYRISVLLLSIYSISLSNHSLLADEKINSLQCINEDGWHVPGTEYIEKASILHQREEVIDGQIIQISEIRPIRKDAGGKEIFSTIPIISVSGNTINYLTKNVVALKILQYSYKGKVFCYLASVATYVRVKGGYGVAGDESTYAYYDKSGDNKFQIREYANMMIGSPTFWHVRLPEWIKEGTQKR